jgi:hypothetical protein
MPVLGSPSLSTGTMRSSKRLYDRHSGSEEKFSPISNNLASPSNGCLKTPTGDVMGSNPSNWLGTSTSPSSHRGSSPQRLDASPSHNSYSQQQQQQQHEHQLDQRHPGDGWSHLNITPRNNAIYAHSDLSDNLDDPRSGHRVPLPHREKGKIPDSVDLDILNGW